MPRNRRERDPLLEDSNDKSRRGWSNGAIAMGSIGGLLILGVIFTAFGMSIHNRVNPHPVPDPLSITTCWSIKASNTFK